MPFNNWSDIWARVLIRHWIIFCTSMDLSLCFVWRHDNILYLSGDHLEYSLRCESTICGKNTGKHFIRWVYNGESGGLIKLVNHVSNVWCMWNGTPLPHHTIGEQERICWLYQSTFHMKTIKQAILFCSVYYFCNIRSE